MTELPRAGGRLPYVSATTSRGKYEYCRGLLVTRRTGSCCVYRLRGEARHERSQGRKLRYGRRESGFGCEKGQGCRGQSDVGPWGHAPTAHLPTLPRAGKRSMQGG